ncbi:head GIN domain-containing protein [Chitinimonas sp.]|uniref:head GIN domain-containing protein n=1 Tax=Chitinimonas sp. TaxID=1934313 RepID=UPI002F94174E
MTRSLLTLACLLALGGCAVVVVPSEGDYYSYSGGSQTVGDGQRRIENRTVGAAEQVEISGSIIADVRQGNTVSLEVEADSNLLPLLHTEVSNGTLKVWMEGSVKTSNGLRVRYTTPQVNKLVLSGSGRINAMGLNADKLSAVCNGSGTIQLAGLATVLDARSNGSGSIEANTLQTSRVKASLNGSGNLVLGQLQGDSLEADIRGSGNLRAAGTVRHVNASVYGSGNANMGGLSAESADLSTYGSGDVTVAVSRTVSARSVGSGDITIYGNPSQRDISGRNVRIKG